jgi:hypothetical protein
MSAPALVLMCALDLLGRSADQLPIRVIATAPRGVSANAQAFVDRRTNTIYLIAAAPAFREALAAQAHTRTKCPPRRTLGMIASIVAHEEWHLKFGSDEKGAYQAQLLELARLGMASTFESYSVRRSMATVLARLPVAEARHTAAVAVASRNDVSITAALPAVGP